ncbi:hypothetical protein AGMMS5026_07780 [Endomicrobiia bacterium]|nr:hypothetical protein AGMMS49523_03300 [Endomicrobiia bacterium]GHT12209.1 hypothetical protein AGMMS49571_03810 [Endomicrobiia bacterium]GHT20570.1 hypothetical protein AGMMS49929_07580 [Endomicrobiia bacterium]GHT26136.1 hypothetical protein AGMMS49995_02110 [Endomicrobiia bacterium]GHT31437.1 hypothetical protein AGMMS5026_07780 [Endomicrobiia bacterium]
MKKLIAGLMCMFMVSQVAHAGEGLIQEYEKEVIISQEEVVESKDTEFKVSRKRYWIQSLVIAAAVGVIEGVALSPFLKIKSSTVVSMRSGR